MLVAIYTAAQQLVPVRGIHTLSRSQKQLKQISKGRSLCAKRRPEQEQGLSKRTRGPRLLQGGLVSALLLNHMATGVGSLPGVIRTRSLSGQEHTKLFDRQTSIAAALEPTAGPSSAPITRFYPAVDSENEDDVDSASDAETQDDEPEWLVFGLSEDEDSDSEGITHRVASGELCRARLDFGKIDAQATLSPVSEEKLMQETIGGQPNKRGYFEPINGKPETATAESSSDVTDTEVVSVTTFNVLAPVYKRIGCEEKRESDERSAWWERNKTILKLLLEKGSSIVCLQEFWLKNAELSELYQSRLSEAGYSTFTLGRTHDKADGLLTAISNDRLRVLDRRDIIFHDCGDRVAQLLHLQAVKLLETCSVEETPLGGSEQWCEGDHPAELILVNTHLMFPHNANACIIRLRQTYKLVDYLGRYQKERKLPPMPIILCGDWNGNKHGQVYKFLRSRGFVSSFDAKKGYTDEDPSSWISHRNHRGNLAGVDFVWLLNPSAQAEPLEADWKTAAYSMIRGKLREAGLREEEAFRFFSGSHKDFITFRGFQRALGELGLAAGSSTFGLGLSDEEMEELAAAVDADKDGKITYEDARVKMAALWPSRNTQTQCTSPKLSSRPMPGVEVIDQCTVDERQDSSLGPEGLEFVVDSASFEPPDMEEGRWPEEYGLSDHASLTCVFAPVRRQDKEQVMNEN